MPKIKFDLNVAKQMLFEKGERIGLVICAVVTLLLVGMGVLMAVSPGQSADGQPWDIALDAESKKLVAQLSAPGTANEIDSTAKEPVKDWIQVVSTIELGPYFSGWENFDRRKRNPTILPVLVGDKQIQMDYIRGGYHAYDVDFVNKKAWIFDQPVAAKAGATGKGAMDGPNTVVVTLKPRRMVVVSAVFPMRAQIEVFRQALKYADASELLDNNMPTPVGLNVHRCEIFPNGKPSPWEPLFLFDPTNEKMTVAPRIQEILREALLDEENTKTLGPYLLMGSATPLLQLANATYPKLVLEGIDLPEEEMEGTDPKMDQKKGGGGAGPYPKGAGAAGPYPMDTKKGGGVGMPGTATVKPNAEAEAPKLNLVDWKKLQKDLQNKDLVEKFSGTGEWEDMSKLLFDPLGQSLEGMKKVPGKIPLPPGKTGPGPANVPANQATEMSDTLVRFFDVDVEPGKTYAYSIQVRFANPNFGKKDEVEYKALADIKELVSPAEATPAIKIPGDFYYYAGEHKVKPPGLVGGSDLKAPDKDKAPVQVHLWLKEFKNPQEFNSQPVGDWAIAERLLIRRGEHIGRNEVAVEIPIWNKAFGAFEIGFLPQAGATKPKVRPRGVHAGIQVNFLTNVTPILVDFEGGLRKNTKVGTAFIAQEESAYEMLVLTPEGKLIVRTSRIDSDPEDPQGKERQDRHKQWLTRVQEISGDNEVGPNTPPGGIMPKGPGPGPGPGR